MTDLIDVSRSSAPSPAPMTATELAAISARLLATADGPWWSTSVGDYEVYSGTGSGDDVLVASCQSRGDAEFVATARGDITRLLIKVDALTRAGEQLMAQVRAHDVARTEAEARAGEAEAALRRVLDSHSADPGGRCRVCEEKWPCTTKKKITAPIDTATEDEHDPDNPDVLVSWSGRLHVRMPGSIAVTATFRVPEYQTLCGKTGRAAPADGEVVDFGRGKGRARGSATCRRADCVFGRPSLTRLTICAPVHGRVVSRPSAFKDRA